MGFLFYKKRIVRSRGGDYEVWAMKERCNSVVRFYAKQISVVIHGENYCVAPELNRVRFNRAINPMFGCFSLDGKVEAIPIMVEEVDLNYYKGMSWHNLRNVKREFLRFIREVERIPENEVRRVT